MIDSINRFDISQQLQVKIAKYKPEQLSDDLIDMLAEEVVREAQFAVRCYSDSAEKKVRAAECLKNLR